MTRRSLLALAFSAALPALIAGCSRRPAPPPDFQLAARFYGGGTNWSNWEIRVSSAGVTDFELSKMEEYRADIQKLVSAGRDARGALDRKRRKHLELEIEALAKEIAERKSKLPTAISAENLSRLYTLSRAVGFDSLPPRIDPDHRPFDDATLELWVQANGAGHRSVLYGWPYVKGGREANRFARLWRLVLEIVPSPNDEQKPDVYRE